MSPGVTCRDERALERFLLGRTSGAEAERLKGHLTQCPACAKALAAFHGRGTLVDGGLDAAPAGVQPEEATAAEPIDGSRGSKCSSPQQTRADGPCDVPTIAPSPTLSGSSLPVGHDFLAPPVEADEIGRLGHYRILKVLGTGGMGLVFQAHDPHLDRLVALKTMLPGVAADSAARQRFQREGRTAAAIKHDHIVTIHQVGEDRGVPFLAMEFLEGESLEDRLKHDKHLQLTEVVLIGRQIAEGLAAAHGRGLIHRDIKPANVWLEPVVAGRSVKMERKVVSAAKNGLPTTGCRVKILDFGLARPAADGASLTQVGAIIGTPAYMAPEQARNLAVDHRADLFSLGCVLYRMCTGERPFKGTDTLSLLAALAADTPTPPRQLNPEVPPMLSDLVMRLLAKNPNDRPESAAAVAIALDVIPRPSEPSPEIPNSGLEIRNISETRKSKTRARQTLLLAGLSILAALLVAAVIIRIQTDKGTLVIEADDPTIEVLVKQGGATIIDRTANRRLELRSGNYEIELAEGREGLRLTTKNFTLTRGGRQVVKAYFEAQPAKLPATGKLIKEQMQSVAAPPRPPDRYLWVRGFDADAYQAWINRLEKTNYRPIFVNGFTADGKARFNGIAVQDGNNFGWKALHSLTAEKYQEEFDSWKEKSRPICVTNYLDGGQMRFGAIWTHDQQPIGFASHHGLTVSQHRLACAEYLQQGLKPFLVTGHADRPEHRLSAIFTNEDVPRVTFDDLPRKNTSSCSTSGPPRGIGRYASPVTAPPMAPASQQYLSATARSVPGKPAIAWTRTNLSSWPARGSPGGFIH